MRRWSSRLYGLALSLLSLSVESNSGFRIHLLTIVQFFFWLQNSRIVKTSKSIVDCSEFAAAISASEGGVRQRVHVHREKKRRHGKSTHSVKPKEINIKFSVPSDESSAPSSKAGLTQTVLTVSATSGVTKINVSQDLDSSSANPSADDVPSTAVQRDRINKVGKS